MHRRLGSALLALGLLFAIACSSSPGAASVTATAPPSLPEPPPGLHALLTRTGLPGVDELLAGVAAGDLDVLARDAVTYELACDRDSNPPADGGFRCEDGEATGTLVTVVRISRCFPFALRHAELRGFLDMLAPPEGLFLEAVYDIDRDVPAKAVVLKRVAAPPAPFATAIVIDVTDDGRVLSAGSCGEFSGIAPDAPRAWPAP